MRSRQLRPRSTAFIEAAAGHLQAEVAAGAEVPFELERRRPGAGARAARRCTATGADGRVHRASASAALERAARPRRGGDAARRLRRARPLPARARGVEPAEATPGDARARAALQALLEDVFGEQTDFELRPERLQRGARRASSARRCASASEVTLVATLHGLAIASPELALTKGLDDRPARRARRGCPTAARLAGDGDGRATWSSCSPCEDEDAARGALARAGARSLDDLLRALRLFGDGRVALGALAWARVGGGAWSPLALGAGGQAARDAAS